MFSLEKTVDGFENYLEGKILLTAILDRLNFFRHNSSYQNAQVTKILTNPN